MRILLVTPFLPYAGARHAGGKLVHFVHDQLATRHEVTVVTRYFPQEKAALDELLRRGWRVDAAAVAGPWFRGGPLAVARTAVSYLGLCRRAERLAATEQFDVCHVVDSETGYFWRPARMPPAVITCHDLVAKRILRSVEKESTPEANHHRVGLVGRLQLAAERRALPRFARVLLLSEIEREWCNRLYPDVRAGVLRYPGGVGFVGMPHREVPGRVLFVGALGRPQNAAALRFLAHEVWPAVQAEVQDAELAVAGAGAAGKLLDELARVPGLRVVGEVESVESAYREAAVFAAPILTGGGIIVKILDALAAGVPVVTTPFGNEGIGADDGSEILVAQDAAGFVRHLVSLLHDEPRRRTIGEAGRRHVERRFPASGVLATLELAYAEALHPGTAESRARGT